MMFTVYLYFRAKDILAVQNPFILRWVDPISQHACNTINERQGTWGQPSCPPFYALHCHHAAMHAHAKRMGLVLFLLRTPIRCAASSSAALQSAVCTLHSQFRTSSSSPASLFPARPSTPPHKSQFTIHKPCPDVSLNSQDDDKTATMCCALTETLALSQSRPLFPFIFFCSPPSLFKLLFRLP